MTLDSWLVARIARELHALLAGSRVQSVRTADGGLTLPCYRRGSTLALHAVVDSNAPLVAVCEVDALQSAKDPSGWVGPLAALLEGYIVRAVHAVPNDRVIYVDLGSRSAFGLAAQSRLVIELQARKANALLLRPRSDGEWIIVAAAKQFAASGDARSVTTGSQYVPPPQRRSRVDRAHFIVRAMDARAATDEAALLKLLAEYDPACTPPLAREVIARTAAPAGPASRARALLAAWEALYREVEDALEDMGEIYVYRRDGEVAACHLIPLSWPGEVAITAASVNELCVAALRDRSLQRRGPAIEGIRKKLATLLSRCQEESAQLVQAREAAASADRLRQAGDAIYAHLADIAPGATVLASPDGPPIALNPLLSAKENAADYFRRYKKARSGLPRIETRLQILRSSKEFWEQLSWELERAAALPAAESGPIVAEIADALGIKAQRKRAPRTRTPERKVELSGAAVAYIGRSPKENERLTFSVAGPNDYWFHARGIPGAHVIVKTGGPEITPQQTEEAASLAARHSRGAKSTSVDVDFTRRKHVRRQSTGRPGMVWYSDFQTIRVAPEPAPRT